MNRIEIVKRHVLVAGLVVCLCLLGMFILVRAWTPAAPRISRPSQPAVAQRAFHTPDEAVDSFLLALANNDDAALISIFGENGDQIVSSGDAAQDREHRTAFVARARQSTRLDRDPMNTGRVFIVVGDDQYPFAVPIVQRQGQWYFDTENGLVELLARRIGSNELDAIELCDGYVEAQYEYAEHDRNGTGLNQYAEKFISSPGKQDGLYWPASVQGDASPISATIVRASMETRGENDKPAPFHGYYFRILKAQGSDAPGGERDYVYKGLMIGGFGLVAWPAEYGSSGIRTFIVNHAGLVYEKDLGPRTTKIATAMRTFNPDDTWRPVRF